MQKIKTWLLFESLSHEEMYNLFCDALIEEIKSWCSDSTVDSQFEYETGYLPLWHVYYINLFPSKIVFTRQRPTTPILKIKKIPPYEMKLSLEFFLFNWNFTIKGKSFPEYFDNNTVIKEYIHDLSEKIKEQFCVIFSKALVFCISNSILLIPKVLKNPELERQIVKELQIEIKHLKDDSFLVLFMKIAKQSPNIFSRFKLFHQFIKERFDQMDTKKMTSSQLAEIRNSSPTAWSWITANRSDIEKWGTTLQADAGEYGL